MQDLINYDFIYKPIVITIRRNILFHRGEFDTLRTEKYLSKVDKATLWVRNQKVQSPLNDIIVPMRGLAIGKFEINHNSIQKTKSDSKIS